MRKVIAVLSLVGILILVNLSIRQKEGHLTDGRIVFLELAPVDPRSLMQGDYMALRFQLASAIREALPTTEEARRRPQQGAATDGHVVVKLDEYKVGAFERLDRGESLAPDELRLRYRVRAGTVRLATNAYFFEEGTGPVYEDARYGEFRVDSDGELLLVSLRGQDLDLLAPSR